MLTTFLYKEAFIAWSDRATTEYDFGSGALHEEELDGITLRVINPKIHDEYEHGS